MAIYHNGRLAGVDTLAPYSQSPNNSGLIAWGHYLNGSVAVGRLYSPPASGMVNWLNGTNIYMSPIDYYSTCSTDISGLLFDGYLDYDNQTLNNKVVTHPKSFAISTEATGQISISKIPLNWKYFSVAGTIPRYTTPKFAITDVEIENQYSLEALFRCTTGENISIIESDYIKFKIVSGIYYAQTSPSNTVSGVYDYGSWNNILFRYKDNVASFLYNFKEVWSGISTDWNSPQETIKWGFYANSPRLHKYIDVSRIAIYDQWLAESDILTRYESADILSYYPLTSNFINYAKILKTNTIL
jgi:hypothetical protein